jgi:hypothetical protein
VVSVHPTRLITSLTKVIVGAPHASVAVIEEISGAGTAVLHPGNTTAAGHVMAGGVTSNVLVIVCVQVAVLPQASAA